MVRSRKKSLATCKRLHDSRRRDKKETQTLREANIELRARVEELEGGGPRDDELEAQAQILSAERKVSDERLARLTLELDEAKAQVKKLSQDLTNSEETASSAFTHWQELDNEISKHEECLTKLRRQNELCILEVRRALMTDASSRAPRLVARLWKNLSGRLSIE